VYGWKEGLGLSSLTFVLRQENFVILGFLAIPARAYCWLPTKYSGHRAYIGRDRVYRRFVAAGIGEPSYVDKCQQTQA